MNRNTELHAGSMPKIHQRRSKFDMSHNVWTTLNTGDLVPIYCEPDVLPGDSIQMDLAQIVRMATPIYPVMDNIIEDIYFFFVPNRILWEHWEEMWGQNDDPWIQTTEYQTPQLTAPSGGWAEGSIADYFGIPTYVDNISINALPFRAYAKIWSDYFRDENLKANAHFYTDDTTRQGSNGTNYVTDCELGGMPAKGAKIHDYFTSCLPAPQKGPSVSIPLGTTAPLMGAAPENPYTGRPTWTAGIDTPLGINRNSNGVTELYTDDTNLTSMGNSSSIALVTNLQDATAATINELRTAFAIQKYYEQAGLYGTRYIEYLRAVFGVESSDARLQRAEYLGGMRVPINMDQILQTSSTDATSPQGNASGFSVTIHRDSLFTKSFEEHGVLLGLALIRQEHSYQQGIPKGFSRKKWTDYYNPYFAFLGNQPVSNKEIYAQGSNVVDSDGNIIDDQVFGYQEAWADYRYKLNIATGHMRSNSPSGSLDSWILTDDYSQLPKLDGDWIDETKDNVDRVIAVSSQLANQFWANYYFKCSYTRCMPTWSVPGLIDHV